MKELCEISTATDHIFSTTQVSSKYLVITMELSSLLYNSMEISVFTAWKYQYLLLFIAFELVVELLLPKYLLPKYLLPRRMNWLLIPLLFDLFFHVVISSAKRLNRVFYNNEF